jgi:hypothetical protein
MKKLLSFLILTVLMQFQLFGQCEVGETQVIIKINSLGDFPSEVFWELYEVDTDSLIASTSPGFLTTSLVRDTLCLLDNIQYRFEAYDEYGDGWNGNEFSIFYDDGFLLKNSMPDNGDGGNGTPQIEESFIFTVGERPGVDCSSTAVIEVNESTFVNTTLYGNNHQTSALFDS